MGTKTYNPYENMVAVLEQAAEKLGLKPDEYETLKYPERELIVSIPVRMDDGTLKVFEGYRVQHNSARGPYKGGIRYHQNANQDEVKALATAFIRVIALYMPMGAFLHASYFTLRSGGKTIVTFIFDSVFMWVVSIPCAYVLSRYTAVPIVPLYFTCQMIEIIKCVIGYVLVKKGIWLQNIVEA